jgi:hypothetical protein
MSLLPSERLSTNQLVTQLNDAQETKHQKQDQNRNEASAAVVGTTEVKAATAEEKDEHNNKNEKIHNRRVLFFHAATMPKLGESHKMLIASVLECASRPGDSPTGT